MLKVQSGFLFLILYSCSIFASGSVSEWASSREWRHLLQYRKTIVGGLRSALQGSSYFLDPDGPTNPEKELAATIQKFKEQPQIQCQYLARQDFLKRHWPGFRPEACPLVEEWLTKVGGERLSLIFATSYLNSAPSSFGHVFLKIHHHENQQGLLDYGINFAARTGDKKGALYAWYGLLGYFPGTFAMMPYHQLIKEYTNLEGRDLWEYTLNFTQEEIQRFIKYLLETERSFVDYYFLDDNCAYQILWALQVARPEMDLLENDVPWMIPLDAAKKVARTGAITGARFRPSLMRTWREQWQNLSHEKQETLIKNIDEFKVSKNLVDPSNEVDVIEAAQTYADIKSYEESSYRELSFLLAKKRSQLPRLPKSEARLPSLSPIDTHDSAQFGFGSGQRSDENFLSFSGRGAFHDELDEDSGVSPFSHLEILSFNVQNPRNEWRLNRLDLLRVLSTQAMDRMESPLSWGLQITYDHFDVAPFAERGVMRGQVGGAIDAWRTRWMGFLLGGYESSWDREWGAWWGVELKALVKAFAKNRWGLTVRSLAGPTDRNILEASLVSVIDLSAQWSLRLQYRDQRLESPILNVRSGSRFELTLSRTFIPF